MDELMNMLGEKEPKEAAAELARVFKTLLPLMTEEEQREAIEQMLGDSGGDKVLGMVHL